MIADADMRNYVRALVENRDTFNAQWEAENGTRFDLGMASGFQLALSFLHTFTDGEYGQRREDQEPLRFSKPIQRRHPRAAEPAQEGGQ